MPVRVHSLRQRIPRELTFLLQAQDLAFALETRDAGTSFVSAFFVEKQSHDKSERDRRFRVGRFDVAHFSYEPDRGHTLPVREPPWADLPDAPVVAATIIAVPRSSLPSNVSVRASVRRALDGILGEVLRYGFPTPAWRFRIGLDVPAAEIVAKIESRRGGHEVVSERRFPIAN